MSKFSKLVGFVAPAKCELSLVGVAAFNVNWRWPPDRIPHRNVFTFK